MIIGNKFIKGIIADLDPMYIQNGYWVFPTLNYRIFNKEGQGYVLTAIDGDTQENNNSVAGEEFRLSENFIALGASSYGGIVFIVSYNETTRETEIGSYPSPNNGKFERVYQPLKNYTTNNPPLMRTPLYAHDRSLFVDVLLKESYDTSIDIYICDGKTANKVINSGFKLDGTLNDRAYDENDFDGQLLQIPGLKDIIDVQLDSVRTGGKLKGGNYHVYVRYATSNFDRTGFVEGQGPIQVYRGEFNASSVEGQIDGETDKRIVLKLDNVDTNYSFVEIALVHSHSIEPRNFVQNAYLVSTPYTTSSSMIVEITGYETLIPMAIGELIKPQALERTCKTHTQVNKRYFGFNWKKDTVNNLYLKELSEKITNKLNVTWIKNGSISSQDVVIDISVAQPQHQYKNYYLTNDRVGYFRGETYLFTVSYVLTSYIITEAFPVQGKDYVNNILNSLGVVRFPTINDRPLFGNDGRLSLLGIEFDMSPLKAQVELDLLSTDSEIKANAEWFSANVKGIIINRAERVPTLLYQGIGCVASNFEIKSQGIIPNYEKYMTENNDGAVHNTGQFHPSSYSGLYKWDMNNLSENVQWGWTGPLNDSDPSDIRVRGNKLIPLFMMYVPMVMAKHDKDELAFITDRAYHSNRCAPNKDYYGIYSPDFIFEPISPDLSNVYIKSYSKLYTRGWDFPKEPGMFPRTAMYYMKGFLQNEELELINEKVEIDSIYKVGEGESNSPLNPVDRFISRASDFGTNIDETLGYIRTSNDRVYSNRNIYTPKYIGVKVKPVTSYDSHNNIHMKIVNVYNQDMDIFDPLTLYSNAVDKRMYRIGDIVKIEYDKPNKRLNFETKQIRYHGDCFLQRSFIKIHTWDSSELKDDNGVIGLEYSDNTKGPVWDLINGQSKNGYRHGAILSIVTENKYNIAMRSDNNVNSYYPKYPHIGWAYLPLNLKGREVYLLNGGYNSVLGTQSSSYYDINIPEGSTHYPVRVRVSAEHTAGSIVDSYRIFDENAKRDYDIEYGKGVAIRSVMNTLAIIQEKAICELNIGREEIKSSTSIGDIILGSASYLPPVAYKRGDYGSQHLSSIIVSDFSMYGVDLLRGVIWQTKVDRDSYGRYQINIVPISKQLLIESEVLRIIGKYGKRRSTIINRIGDAPAEFIGVVSGKDTEHNEIMFTFLTRKLNVEPIDVDRVILWELRNNVDYITRLPYYSIQIGNSYYVGDTFRIGNEYYIVTQAFSANTTNINDYNQVQKLTEIDVVQFQLGETYTDQFVYIDEIADTTHPFWNVLAQMTEVCCIDDVCYKKGIIMYVEGTKTSDDILRQPPFKILAMCLKLHYTPFWDTLVFSELIQAFVGKYSVGSHLYMNIDSETYSFDIGNNNEFSYLHNSGKTLHIKNQQDKAIISIMANGLREEESVADFVKTYEYIDIYTNRPLFSKVLFETENSIGVKEPFHSNGVSFWSDPEYLENKYSMPVTAQIASKDASYLIDTQLRGKWLKITLEYEGDEKKQINSVMTEINISES
jgi:hypothetical protein